MTAAAFLDRDGVLNEKPPEGAYVTAIAGLRVIPGAGRAVAALRDLGYVPVVVTNQRGVARGEMDLTTVGLVNDTLASSLALEGGVIERWFVCPHAHGSCDCRKPQPGLLYQAAAALPDIELRSSVCIGDALTDLQAGAAAGCAGYLVAAPHAATRILAEARELGIVVAGVGSTLADVVRILPPAGARPAGARATRVPADSIKR